MATTSNASETRPGLRRAGPGLLLLEARLMFDGAAVGDAAEVLIDDETLPPEPLTPLPPAVRPVEEDVTEAAQSPADAQVKSSAEPEVYTDEQKDRAETESLDAPEGFASDQDAVLERIRTELNREQPEALLFETFPGDQSKEPDSAWLGRAQELVTEIREERFEPNLEWFDDDAMQGLAGAFSTELRPDTGTILLNRDWWQLEPSQEERQRVLTEEIGHALDWRLNGERDTSGDEGEAFAARIDGQSLSTLDTLRLAYENDQRVLTIDGRSVTVEAASLAFVSAYRVYDGVFPADKEQNRNHFLGDDPLSLVQVDDKRDSSEFSGNDIAVELTARNQQGNMETFYGWISRPIKEQGIVRGFYFWTDTRFSDLASATADGNRDGDRNVGNNDGLILVFDQPWFDAIINAGRAGQVASSDAFYDAGAGFYALGDNYDFVGSSSDRVDSAMNSLLVPNQAPIANPDLFTLQEGSTATGSVLANDSDPDGQPLTVTGYTIAGEAGPFTLGQTVTIDGVGGFSLSADGGFQFTPAATYSGPVPTITYTIEDGAGGQAESSLTLLIDPVAQPPTSADFAFSLVEGSERLLTVSDFAFQDPDADAFASVRIETPPAAGSLQLHDGTGWQAVTGSSDIALVDVHAGRLKYVPDGNSDTGFTFRVVDDSNTASAAAYTATVTVVANAAPQPVAQTEADPAIEGTDGSPGQTTTGNILDAHGQPDLTVTMAGTQTVADSGPTTVAGRYGSFAIQADGSFTYTANDSDAQVDALNTGQTLSDTLVYTVTDTQGRSVDSVLTVTITGSNDTPSAANDFASVDELATAHADGHYGTATGNVLPNDTDVDDAGLTVVIGTGDSIGSSFDATLNATSPIDTVSYTVTDAGGTNWTANGGVTNDAGNPQRVTLNDGTLLNAIDGSPLTVYRTGTGAGATLVLSSPESLYRYAAGTVFSADGSTSQLTIAIDSATVQSTTTVTATSGDLATLKTTLDELASGESLDVSGTGIPDGTTVTAIDTTAGTITLSQAVAIENQALSFSTGETLVPQPGEMFLQGTYGYLALRSDGSYTYTLTDDSLTDSQTRDETFTYTVQDTAGASDTADLVVRIHGTSAASEALANDDTGATPRGTLLTVAATGLLGNDSNATQVDSYTWNGQSGTLGTATVLAGVGSLTIEADGSYSFDPDADFVGAAPTVVYTASNAGSGPSSATLNLSVTASNRPPASTDAAIDTQTDTSRLVPLSAFGTYTDPDGDPLDRVVISTLPNKGSLEAYDGSAWNAVNAGDSLTAADISSGNLRYTPAAGESGNNYTSVVFTVNDGTANSASTNTLTINVLDAVGPSAGVAPVNSLPVTLTTASHTPLPISGVSVDDADDDIATVHLSPLTGTVSVTASGSGTISGAGTSEAPLLLTGTKAELNAMLDTLTYTPDPQQATEDAIRIETVDQGGRRDIDALTITVTADDRPITVTGTAVNEASPWVHFKVAGADGQSIQLGLAEGSSGTSTTIGADLAPLLQVYLSGTWTPYDGGALSLPTDGTAGSLLVRAAVFQDGVAEGIESVDLRASNAAGTAATGTSTIQDDGQGLIFLDGEADLALSGSSAGDSGYPSALDDDRPISVNSIAVNEASPYGVFTVSGHAGQRVTLDLIAGTATTQSGTPPSDGSVDFGPTLEIANGGTWLPYTAGTEVTLTGSTLLVRTSIVNDTPFEGQERFSLAVSLAGLDRSVYGQGSIYDDGTGDFYTADNTSGAPQTAADASLAPSDDRSLAIGDVTINEASDQAVMTLTGNPGQTVTLSLLNASQSGTVSGQANLQATGNTSLLRIFSGLDGNGDAIWLDNDPEAALPTFDGNGKLYVRVDTRSEQDDVSEGAETIQLQATLARQAITGAGVTNTPIAGSATTGTLTIVDDGTGLRHTGAMTALPNNAGWTPTTADTELDDDQPASPPGPPSGRGPGTIPGPPATPPAFTPAATPATPAPAANTAASPTPQTPSAPAIILAVPEPAADAPGSAPAPTNTPGRGSDPGPAPQAMGTTLSPRAVQQPGPGQQSAPQADTAGGETRAETTALPGNAVRQGGIEDRGPAPGLSQPANGTNETGFQVRVDPTLRIGTEHELRIDRAIPDLALSGRTASFEFVVPTDAFVHTDATAEVRLSALMLDGSELPEWIGFDPQTGRLDGTPPEPIDGELLIRIVARDEIGREAETVLRIRADDTTEDLENDELQTPPVPADGIETPETEPPQALGIGTGEPGGMGLAGYPGLTATLERIGALDWQQEQEALIRLSREAWLAVNALEFNTSDHG